MRTTRNADPKRLKKAQAEKLLQIANDGRRRSGDRKWALEQLALSGYAISENDGAVGRKVFARIRAMRERLTLGKGATAKDLINEGRRP